MKKQFKLSEYVERLRGCGLLSDAVFASDETVEGLTFDSRQAGPGTLFVCKGASFKKQYLDSAMERGSIAAVSERPYDCEKLILVNDIRRTMAVLSNMFYCEPWREFPLIGLTGTKGKSTSLAYITNIMEHSKICGPERFGYISTIYTYDGVEYFESHLTTPEAIELGLRLRNIADSGLYAAGMEVSSQALKYDRSFGIIFDIACFTNFGLDHIGETEHPTLKDYLKSKLKIFDQCKTAIVNLDSERIEDILSAASKGRYVEKLITYSAKDPSADYKFSGLRKEDGKTLFEIDGMGTITLSMSGLFNAENAVAAAIITKLLGASIDEIKAGLLNARAAGRMEVFENKKRDLVVISDYAHNALSFERLFNSVASEYPGYRIEAVFGAPGGKGYSRRDELPRVAAKYADFVWITEEDPADEDPQEISKQVYENLLKYGGKGAVVIDRTEAITGAIRNAPRKTVLLLIAKGREEYMHRGKDFVPIKSDSALAEELINA